MSIRRSAFGLLTLIISVLGLGNQALALGVVSPQSSVNLISNTGLHVVGNAIQNGNGQTLFLHGLNRGGTEADCIRGNDYNFGVATQDYINVIKSWNVNAVRVTLNEDCWLGVNTNSTNAAYMGSAYQQAVINYVSLLTSNNLVAILDLHWSAPGTTPATAQSPMPDADHSVAFWSSVAATFRGNSAVIFDLFNEPYIDNIYGPQSSDATWKCWRDGAAACSGTTIHYAVAGMQTLVNTVRAAGANNIVMLGGLQYGNELSLWLNYKPVDPTGNLAASWHMYAPDNYCSNLACWQTYVAPVAARVPLVAGEFGALPTKLGLCDAVSLNTFWLFMEDLQQGYLAWVFQPWGGSCSSGFNWAMVSDNKGTPTDYGALYLTHLLGLPGIYP